MVAGSAVIGVRFPTAPDLASQREASIDGKPISAVRLICQYQTPREVDSETRSTRHSLRRDFITHVDANTVSLGCPHQWSKNALLTVTVIVVSLVPELR